MSASTDGAGAFPAAPHPEADESAAAKAGKKAKTKAKARPPAEEAVEKEAPLGTSKAVETMFRNAIRVELDLIALAATKANIMISLNGFIISALMISGAFLFASSPSFLIPAGVFMLTSAVSIVFALLAASPEHAQMFTATAAWFRAWRAGTARLGELNAYLMHGRSKAQDEGLNLLIYEDRVALSSDDFWDQMQGLLRTRDEIYRQMTNQLYWLGEMANRKFKLLNVSYTVFRWGLAATIVVFFGLKIALWTFPSLAGPREAAALRSLGIAEFEDIYEPSAVQQLADGRILVVEDEASRAFSLLSLSPDGTLVEDSTADLRLTRAFGRRLNDLEGLSIDDSEFIYATTSHSLNADGQRRPDREQLLRFRIRGGSAGDISSFTALRDTLAGSGVLLQQIADLTGEPADFSRLNIEGLAYWRESGHLLLGLREPTVAGKSLILTIENPAEMFDGSAPPQFAPPILLDLREGGIRALSYDPVLGAFLIVNEIEGHEGNRYSQLWTWSGEPEAAPEPVALPDIINLNNVESIDTITVGGEPRLLIMSDEGNEKKNRPAKYMMLDYGQLLQ